MRFRGSNFVLFLSLLLVVLFGPAASLRGQEQSGIRITGNYAVVIQELPFTLTAPSGDLHFWNLPVGWGVEQSGASIIVSKASQGTFAVSCNVIRIDWMGKKVTQQTYSLPVNIGKLPNPGPGPGPGPGPEPEPDATAFEKAIAAAFTADGSPKQYALQLKALYDVGLGLVRDVANTKVEHVASAMSRASAQLDKSGALPKSALKNVRAEIARKLDPLFADLSKPLTVESRSTLENYFTDIITALGKLP